MRGEIFMLLLATWPYLQAPYTSIKKTFRRISQKEVELSCESQGFPLAHVTWSNSKFNAPYLTNRSENSQVQNSDGFFVVTSRLVVTYDPDNYTCSYVTDDGKTSQTATFVIPESFQDFKGAERDFNSKTLKGEELQKISVTLF
ncbi:programmed cell death 1 ligand 1 isoform X1 [Tachysurus ichikawai]